MFPLNFNENIMTLILRGTRREESFAGAATTIPYPIETCIQCNSDVSRIYSFIFTQESSDIYNAYIIYQSYNIFLLM